MKAPPSQDSTAPKRQKKANKFRTIIAPKPIVDEIEEFRRRHDIPSNSQTLGLLLREAMKVEEMRKQIEGLNKTVMLLINKIPDPPPRVQP